MKPRRDKGRIEGPFVAMLIDTLKSPAWRALSPYARVVYMALKSHYSINSRNNGHIYLSIRDGAEETGLDMKTVGRALLELKHYGFIVQTTPGSLGVNGKGKAPHWRLTEVGYMTDRPTRDFLKWDGELFNERSYARKNTIPLRRTEQGVPPGGSPLHRQTEQSPEKVYRRTEHTDEQGCTVRRSISRFTISPPQSDSVAPPVPDPDPANDLTIPAFLDRRDPERLHAVALSF